jgi:hypothetical protein
MSALFVILTVFALLPAASVRFAADSRELLRRPQRSLLYRRL